MYNAGSMGRFQCAGYLNRDIKRKTRSHRTSVQPLSERLPIHKFSDDELRVTFRVQISSVMVTSVGMIQG